MVHIPRRKLIPMGLAAAAFGPPKASQAGALPLLVVPVVAIFQNIDHKTWFELVSTAFGIFSSSATIYSALAADTSGSGSANSTGGLARIASAVFGRQPELSEDLKNIRMVIRDELQRSELNRTLRTLRNRSRHFADFTLDYPNGPEKTTELMAEFGQITDALNDLADDGSAFIYPSYAAGTATQLLIHKSLQNIGKGAGPKNIKAELEKHVGVISTWVDRSRPTNPLPLSDALQPEIKELMEFLGHNLEVRILETTIRDDREELVQGSNPPKMQTVSSWHVNDRALVYKGFDASGKVKLEPKVTRTKEFATSGDRPYRYSFSGYSVGSYYNATQPDLVKVFTCLKSDDAYEKFNAVPNASGGVVLPEAMLPRVNERDGCVQSIYEQKRDRLNALRDLDQNYKASHQAMMSTLNSLQALQA